MSYCRWSSMNWMCDVYVYADCNGGWTTHVASARRMMPPIPDISFGGISSFIYRWSGAVWDKETRKVVYPSKVKKSLAGLWWSFSSFWHNRIHMGSLHVIPLRPIRLKHDGESFNDETAQDCADRLEYLRSVGYKVDQCAIERLRGEAE